MEKIILDTNVLIDGIKDEHSAAWKIVEKVFSEQLILCVSRKLRREYETILRREISDENYRQRIHALFDIAEEVHVNGFQRIVQDDPEDDKVIATALAAQANVLISEDRHLLDLDPYGDLRIMRPAEFLNRETQDSSWGDFARMIGLN
jgi:putative PIN family toxin of toxin-antitoxin system